MGSRRGSRCPRLVDRVHQVGGASFKHHASGCVLEPVAMTILGLVASIVSFSVGRALAKLTGMLTA